MHKKIKDNEYFQEWAKSRNLDIDDIDRISATPLAARYDASSVEDLLELGKDVLDSHETIKKFTGDSPHFGQTCDRIDAEYILIVALIDTVSPELSDFIADYLAAIMSNKDPGEVVSG